MENNIFQRIRNVVRETRLNNITPTHLVLSGKEQEELIDYLYENLLLEVSMQEPHQIMGMEIITDERKIARLPHGKDAN